MDQGRAALVQRLQQWIARYKDQRYGDQGLRLQMEHARDIMADALAALTAPAPEAAPEKELRALVNEVQAWLGLDEHGLRQLLGHTNVGVMLRKLNEARAALTPQPVITPDDERGIRHVIVGGERVSGKGLETLTGPKSIDFTVSDFPLLYTVTVDGVVTYEGRDARAADEARREAVAALIGEKP
jgi:hypothetical protein